jgi:hypothetical protein
MKLTLTLAFIVILTFATCALGADVPPVNSTWVEGHWVTVEGQQVWLPGYWKAPSKPQVQQVQVVYVQQPTIIYVQQPAPRVIYVQQPQSTFMNFGFSSGFYGGGYYNGGCYNGHSHSHTRFVVSGTFGR